MTLAEQAAGMGITGDVLAEILAADRRLDAALAAADETESGDVEIWPENADAVRLFFALDTQWRTAVLPGKVAVIVKTSLDYSPAPGTAAALGITYDEDCLDRLRILERAALGELGRQDAARVKGLG